MLGLSAVSGLAQQMADMNPAGMFLMDLSSGTSMNPPAWAMPMVMEEMAGKRARRGIVGEQPFTK